MITPNAAAIAEQRAPLIVNGDDFGYSPQVNQAIAESFARRFCASTTIMANMPAFEAACDVAQRDDFADQVGVHLVLTEGRPLTEAIARCPRFCDGSGRFRLTRYERVWRLSPAEELAVAGELHAQISRCRRHGLALTHADSHHHIHEEWGLLQTVVRVCRAEGIPYVRLARNCGRGRGQAQRAYRGLVNRTLRIAGLAGTRYFGSIPDRESLPDRACRAGRPPLMEVMVHPMYNLEGVLIDQTTGRDLAAWAGTLQFSEEIVSYANHRTVMASAAGCPRRASRTPLPWRPGV